MKTILTKEGDYKRLSEQDANHEVKMGRAKYVSKIEWKKKVRDISKVETITIAEQKGEQTKSAKAIKAAKLKSRQRQ